MKLRIARKVIKAVSGPSATWHVCNDKWTCVRKDSKAYCRRHARRVAKGDGYPWQTAFKAQAVLERYKMHFELALVKAEAWARGHERR